MPDYAIQLIRHGGDEYPRRCGDVYTDGAEHILCTDFIWEYLKLDDEEDPELPLHLTLRLCSDEAEGYSVAYFDDDACRAWLKGEIDDPECQHFEYGRELYDGLADIISGIVTELVDIPEYQRRAYEFWFKIEVDDERN